MAAGDVVVDINSADAKQSVILDGVDDTLEFPVDTFERQKMTVSCWFKPSKLLNAANYPAQVYLFQVGTRLVFSFGTESDAAAGNLQLEYYDGAFAQVLSGVTSWARNTWFWVSFAIDDVTGERSIYINGVLANSATDITTIVYSGGRKSNFGSSWVPGNFFFGCIGDCKIWDRALTAAEMLDEYQGTKVLKGLIHKYDFLDGTANDQVGSINGTVTGGRIGNFDGAIAEKIQAARVTENDIYLISETAKETQVVTPKIEEAK